jgi:hypothetical protein
MELISTILKKLIPIYGFFVNIQFNFFNIPFLLSNAASNLTAYSQAFLTKFYFGLF